MNSVRLSLNPSVAVVEPELESVTAVDDPWNVLVWDDPVNTMEYVTFVFQQLFGFSKEKAKRLMLEVHNDGKSIVRSGTRDEAERDVFALHEYGLWATMEQNPQ